VREGAESRDVRQWGVIDVGDVPGAVLRVRDSAAKTGREGTVDVELLLGEERISSCRIIPLRLRVGAAVVRMDGIGAVKTAEAFRNRGLARRVLNRAIELMERGDAALTTLYGITNFYPKFGYITVGPESTVALPPLQEDAALPEGYTARLFRREDLGQVQDLYRRMIAHSVGPALRPDDGYPWTALLNTLEDGMSADCRVVTDPGGRVCGYVWRGRDLGFVRAHSRFNPDDLVVADVVAVEPPAADTVLTVCRRWAAEEAARRDVRHVLIYTPHEGAVTAAAMQTQATLARGYGPDGGWMGRVLSTERLLSSLQPELSRRLREAGNTAHRTLRVVTEAGEATLLVDGGSVRVTQEPGEPSEALHCRMPQTTLARLTLGAYPPDDLLQRLSDPPEERASELLRTMFPARPAQTFLADRF
jgi:GNAT superfamily N-acetyltransferase